MQDEDDAWTEYDEEEEATEEEEKDIKTKESKDEVVEEKREDVEPEMIDEIDQFANFVREFEARRKELTTKTEEKRKQLRQLIRVT